MITGLLLWVFMWSAEQDDHASEHGNLSDSEGGVMSGSDKHEQSSVAVTRWTDKMELFMEYPVLTTGKTEKFIIHLTTLDDFQPVRTGAVKLVFTHESGKTYEVYRDSLLREGIFTPSVELAEAGDYRFTLSYTGESIQDSFEIKDFSVYRETEDIPDLHDDGGEEISFLKEQQWKIDFRTEPAERRPIRSSLRAIANVLPQQKAYAVLTSPVDGILGIEHNQSLVFPGSAVNKGQTLASISPTLQGGNGWTEIKLSYEKARRDYERAQRLKSGNAISQREYEDIERNYLVKKASYESFIESGSGSSDSEIYQVKAPISGSIMKMQLSPGQKIEAGQELMTIVDHSTVWLQVNVYESDYYRMSELAGIYLTIPGMDSGVSVPQEDLRLLSIGNTIDPDKRTVPVLLEITNPEKLLIINQHLDVELYFGNTDPALCVPGSAIFDDEANEVVFVHKGGESFEKRVITVGDHEDSWTSILTGLEDGERVVTLGGYHVKLASITVETGHGHSH